MTGKQIDAIRARCKAATPGPWHVAGAFNQFFERDTGDDPDLAPILGEIWRTPMFESVTGQPLADIEFIAHAREDIPTLLGALEKAEKAIDKEEAANRSYLTTLSLLRADYVDAIADRDSWKARAEALERAVRGNCDFCKHRVEAPSQEHEWCWNNKREDWQFDEARFAGGGDS